MGVTPGRVIVDVHSAGDPIAGEITAAAGAPQPFTGWLQLLSRLQEALGELRGTAEDSTDGGGAA